MQRVRSILAFLVGVLGVAWVVWGLSGAKRVQARSYSANVTVYFSPRGGATAAVVDALNEARKEVLVQAYSLTSKPIAKALKGAHRRGVRVKLLLDKSNETQSSSAAGELCNAGIETRIDDRHAAAHNKVIIIDGEVVITGSFNFTQVAEQSNAENLLVIRDSPELAKAFVANFEAHYDHARPYRRGPRWWPRWLPWPPWPSPRGKAPT
ncbi:MAG: phospholipase D family protein [Armatimonadota bacterium]|nr:phospholipase D family protein [Armatimonadota bacterium]